MIRGISIRLRITLFLVAAIVLTLGSATWLLDSRIDNEVAAEADTNLLERAQALSDLFRIEPTAGQQTLRSGHMPEFLADDGIVYFKIDCQGERALSSATAAGLDWPTPALDKPVFADMSDSRHTELRAIALSFAPPHSAGSDLASGTSAKELGSPSNCSLGLAVDLKPVRSFQRAMDHIEYGCILVALLIVVLLTPLLIRRGLQPLSRLAEAMQLIGPESPGRRLDNDSAFELQPLIMRFNEVLSRMEEGLLRERQFASGVAHELRTPLAELRTMIEVELRYPRARDPRALLADVGAIGREMERLVTALLLLTRIEAGIEQVQYRSIDVGALTYKMLDRHRSEIEKRHLDLSIHAPEKLFWQADPTLLEVILGNLVSNAATYAPAGSRLVLVYQSNTWRLKNDAADLSKADVALMHQRFWRKGKDAGVHTGLGIALATAAASAQSMCVSLTFDAGQIQATVMTHKDTSCAMPIDVAIADTPHLALES